MYISLTFHPHIYSEQSPSKIILSGPLYEDLHNIFGAGLREHLATL